MEKINLTKSEINDLIHFSTDLKRGSFGIVAPISNNRALKIDALLLDDNHFISDEKIEAAKDSGYSGISVRQIEKLCSMRQVIKKSSLPYGLAYYNNFPVAIILKYFGYHNDLLSLPDERLQSFYKVITLLVEELDELMQHYIYQSDIKEDNFLYSLDNFKPEVIDLDGIYVSVGNHENISNEEQIYSETLQMFQFLVKERLHRMNLTDAECEKRYDEARQGIYGIYTYDGAKAYISNLICEKVLVKKR